MVMLTGLARVARKTGYPVVEVSGWKKRGHGQMSTVRSIMAHHTAGAAGGNYPSLAVVRDGHGGLKGPLAHYGLGRDGTIYVIAAGLCYHAGAVSSTAYRNAHSIGIEAENTGTGQTWPTVQLDAYVKLCKALIDEFKLPVSAVIGHKEAATPRGRKIDPNFSSPSLSMADFRRAVTAGSYGGTNAPSKPSTSTASSSSSPSSASKAWPHAQLPVTSKHTTASHRAWVAMLAGVGFKDKRLTLAIQKWLQWNGYYRGYRLDGQFGPATVRALQQFLKAKGFYRGVIDGDRGPLTIQAEIRYINSQAKHYR